MGWQLVKTLQSIEGFQEVRGYRGDFRYFQIIYPERPELEVANVGHLIIAGSAARDVGGVAQKAVKNEWAIWYTRQEIDLDGVDYGAAVLYFVGRRSPYRNQTVEFWNFY